MNFKEAIEKRHTVRKFKEEKLSSDVVKKLRDRISAINQEQNLKLELVIGDGSAIPFPFKLMLAKGAVNYIVLAGKKTDDLAEKLGYCGSDLCLYAQTLGLNSWWIAGTYSKGKVSKAINTDADTEIMSIIVIGYGENQGKPHKSKSEAEVSRYQGEMPEWFHEGVKAALLAPTAMNKQGFFLEGEGDEVKLSYKEGAFSGVDKGIIKHHFEVGAGKTSFRWG